MRQRMSASERDSALERQHEIGVESNVGRSLCTIIYAYACARKSRFACVRAAHVASAFGSRWVRQGRLSDACSPFRSICILLLNWPRILPPFKIINKNALVFLTISSVARHSRAIANCVVTASR